MALPYFYSNDLNSNPVVLDEDTSRHIVQVLRMKLADELLLTDGKGQKAKAIITGDHRKHCTVQLVSVENEQRRLPLVAIGISLIKNVTRFEWFLEKATEIGVQEIVPLICERTEKEKFRYDRLNNIIISAMLQSQQCWLPQLHPPVDFEKAVSTCTVERKFIAHCLPQQKSKFMQTDALSPSIVLIGPEGDFTEAEIQVALENDFQPVSLGSTRLRTETAGIVAATLLCIA
ncbi:MAG: 16S rRNA (uracil(1498)-N(3))-methyltransferase [Flavisolibacter sp.]|nr:16S rRNA (uracil(1498)-N(3))-methyltransferase [Flavisolibacter sp.]MBD0351614.1 16S rRNA (uracil(1498)-N(3))-methyltransferase [Flavisolibacter sp.]